VECGEVRRQPGGEALQKMAGKHKSGDYEKRIRKLTRL